MRIAVAGGTGLIGRFVVDAARAAGHTTSRRAVVVLPLPGAAGRLAATGGLLPQAAGPRGEQTFEQWLAVTPG